MNHKNESNRTEDTFDGISRRQSILQKLELNGEVSVASLADEFSVSPMTIRRDLHFFARQGILETHYGGARLSKSKNSVPDFPSRSEKMLEDKYSLGKKAAGFITEGDTIFLDCGTTVLQIVKYFPDVHATLITNSFSAIQQLSTNRKINLIVTPGTYREEIGGPLDISTIEFVRKYQVDKSFTGALFCPPDFGITTSDELDALFKHTLCEQSDKTFLMADHTKFYGKGFVKYADFKDFDYILTNQELNPQIQEKIQKLNPSLLLC